MASPQDLATAIRTIRPRLDVEVEAGPAELPGRRRTQPLDLTRAHQDLGYDPQFDLAKGIADFIQELQRAA